MARAGKYSFIIEQGSTFNRQIRYTDSNGSPVDLTGFGARMQIRESYDSATTIISLTTTVSGDGTGIVMTPTSGAIDITISAASSSQLAFSGEAVFDLELYSGSGATEYVKRLIEGRVKISREVTR